MAQTWDILYSDTWRSADRFFYLDVIERYGQPVLDVGCGTGRLLLDYLAQGIDIDGVDNSPEMLALCREKAAALGLSPNLYGQFMDTMALPRTYRTILIPPGFSQLIREPEAADQALAHCYAYLQSGGVLVASFMTLGREGDSLEATWEKVAGGEDGAIVRRVAVACSHDDPAAASDHTHDLYPIIVEGKLCFARWRECRVH